MLTGLREWQDTFAARLSGEAGAGDRRIAIHRHHVASSLAKVLASTFPTVQALVGADFFRQLAQAFVARELPTQPVLSEYGASFADFVASYAPAAGLPYLPDMARLDWALNVAFHSSRGAHLAAADLAALPPDRLAASSFVLAPGSALIRSDFPIDLVWAASQPGAPDDKVDIGQGPARLLVLRRSDDAGFLVLGEGEAAFVHRLGAGLSLEVAAGAAFAADSVFELSRSFARLLACEIFVAVR